MSENMPKRQVLSTGVHDFAMLRRENLLYVDKTACLQQLVTTNQRIFLSRQRRFDKSPTVSTLVAMFSGQMELFRGLAAESWVGGAGETTDACVATQQGERR